MELGYEDGLSFMYKPLFGREKPITLIEEYYGNLTAEIMFPSAAARIRA